jgi:hypothetical protein
MDNNTIGKTNTSNTERIIVRVDVMNRAYAERKELLKALRDLNSVKSEPWTDEQRQLKFKVGCEIDDILKKYESEVIE